MKSEEKLARGPRFRGDDRKKLTGIPAGTHINTDLLNVKNSCKSAFPQGSAKIRVLFFTTFAEAMEDTYKTIQAPAEGLFKDKGSRFIARAYPVESVEEVKEILASLRKEYHDARHHCYAYRIGPGDAVYRVNDDGEPANSAGKPILGQIQSRELTNILIVVIRYFGGILLGVGGLIQAYRTAAKESISHAAIVVKTFNCPVTIRFPYPAMNDVMRIIRDSKAEIVKQESGMSCIVVVRIRMGAAEGLTGQLHRIDSVEAQVDTL